MTRKTRDYTSLKDETERLYDAIDLNMTNVKDYSMQHVISVYWSQTDQEHRKRLVQIYIGDTGVILRVLGLLDFINQMVDAADENGWLPEGGGEVVCEAGGSLYIDTKGLNEDALRDHIVWMKIGKNKALVDIEELLKATRYA